MHFVHLTWGRQSGRDSKMTSSTPMGTVICSSSRLFATRVRRRTLPTLSWEDTAIWRRPMDRLFSFDDDKLSRLSKAGDRRPVTSRIKSDWYATPIVGNYIAHGLERSNHFLLPVLAACSMSFLLADKISSFLSVRRSANAQMMSLLCGQTEWFDTGAVL